MEKILILYYSQSGQLESVVNSFSKDLESSENIKLTKKAIQPKQAYPYPWPFFTFMDAFPESVYMDGCEIEDLQLDEPEQFDLIILAYTSWFLAPSIPITGLLKSSQAKKIFKDKPVITLIACRDMWVMAQEKMKILLKDVEATLIDNVVLTDQGGSLYGFITTPRWLLTGKKTPFWFFPPAGVAPQEIDNTSRFGKRLVTSISESPDILDKAKPLLSNLGAVNVNGKLVASEKIATRSFLAWGKLIKLAGPSESFRRKIVITLYFIFLILMILTLVPLNIIIRKILYPFNKAKIDEQVAYYEQPSGK